ncbi:MAG: replication factor C large subunit [Candidatus Thermoplasmatota archaeon]
MDWTEKHRPRSLKDVVGNGPAVGRLKAWADAWAGGTPPERRAVVLAGPPGTGKTSTALALAADMGWTAIELNASDSRNAGTIRKVATAGAIHHTFASDGSFGDGGAGRKLIILDEADNLYERAGEGGLDDSGSDLSDKGGKAQIVETIRTTHQPIVLIVNDLYALQKGSGSALRSLCEEIKFQRVNVRSIPAALGRIAAAEGVTVDREVLEAIAVKAEGDLRAAVRDFESIAIGRKHVSVKELGSLGQRDTTGSMFDLVRHVLKGRKLDDVRKEVWSVDATPDDLALWIDENMAKEYRDPEDLVRGYQMLARADQFLGRTRRTQNYGLWSYAGELATLGVMTARQKEYTGFQAFGFPQWLSRMGRTKGMRQAKDEVALVLGRATHTSKRKARLDMVEAFTFLFQTDREFAIEQTFELELDDEQVALLLGDQANAKLVKDIRAAVEVRTPVFPPVAPAKTKALPDEDDEEAAPPAKSKATVRVEEPAEDADEAPKKPTPKPGQKGLFGF